MPLSLRLSRLRHLLLQLLAAGLLLACATLPAIAREMVSVARPSVNMRGGAGTAHQALWTLSRGYPLEVLGRQGRWLHVRDFESDTGWVYRPLVGKQPHVIVKSERANLRSAPSTRSRILGKVEYGELLRTLGHRTDWVRVQHDSGLEAWISRRLVWGW